MDGRWGGERRWAGQDSPAVGATVDELRFAFASCQHYEVGYFTSLEHLSREDVDFAVHLGDYIYEYAEHDGDTVRHHEGPEIVTLDHYRNRYTQYKSDPALQAAHAAMPWIMTFDDHEVDNNWGECLRTGRSESRTTHAPACFCFPGLLRDDAASYLDGARRPEYAGLSPPELRQPHTDECARHASVPERSAVLGRAGAYLCGTHLAGAVHSGAAQRDWLFEGLAVSGAGWNVMAQQVMVARLRGESDEGDDTWAMDKWDGYPMERRAFLDHLESTEVNNPVVLTGDIHSNWVADLHTDFDDLSSPVVGTEFVGTSLSSGGDGADMTNGGRASLSHNPHIKFYNGQRGYVTATVTPDTWTSEYKVVDKVSEPGGSLSTRATFVVESGSPGAQED